MNQKYIDYGVKPKRLINAVKKLQEWNLVRHDYNPVGKSNFELFKIILGCFKKTKTEDLPPSVVILVYEIYGESQEKDPKTCAGPLKEDCRKCKSIKLCPNANYFTTRIPHWILEYSLKNLSLSAFKIFMYLNRKANFDPSSNHFGRCFPSRQEIFEHTGVSPSNMGKYYIEMEKHGLIERSEPIKQYRDGCYGSYVVFTVTWFKKWKRYGMYGRRDRQDFRLD